MKSATEQLALIRRGVEAITPEDELVKKLERSVKTGKPLRVKYGIDPTASDVHLGHTVPLQKMRLFQQLGHQAVLIIGNYTALVGDPSGRDQTRVRLTHDQVEKNSVDYLKQISKVIDISKAEVTRNGDWFSQFSFLRVMELTSKTTVQRMLERDDFTNRFRATPSKPIYLHECLYPLMQGWDSVEIKADIELGGSEQLFNLMMGRQLQQDQGQEPQICLTLPILRGLDGERRMGKSLGNYIGVGEPAYEMFAKTMSIPDALMEEWYKLLTDRPEAEAVALIQGDPMEAKKQLGAEIVQFYYGMDEAKAARTEWESRFSFRNDPSEIEERELNRSCIPDGTIRAWRLLVELRLVSSNNDARTQIEQGAMNIGSSKERINDPKQAVEVTAGLVVRLGKKKRVRVKIVD